VISLSSGKVINIIDDNGLCVNIERGIVGKGLYDGLGIPKEVGDKALTEVCEGRWWVIHRYLSSDGRVKGVYININTPPEIIPYNNVKYVDLGIDLLLKEGRVCKLVDTEEFRELIRNNSLRYDVLIEVLKTLNTLLTSLCTVEDKP
jgi:protein associated with RNAse G/E